MGNWSDNQTKVKNRQEKDKTRREKLAGYFFNLSQLTFAAMVLGGFTPLYSERVVGVNRIMVSLGIMLTAVFAIISYLILKQD